MENDLEKYLNKIIQNLSSLDGKIIGEDMQPSVTRLAKDNKGAMVNYIVDKYLKKELEDEYLEQTKKEFNISSDEIIEEMIKREIEKAFKG